MKMNKSYNTRYYYNIESNGVETLYNYCAENDIQVDKWRPEMRPFR